jgi:hypothetical protein
MLWINYVEPPNICKLLNLVCLELFLVKNVELLRE